ncbi:hypothetical protein J3F83DRAFT_435760 [Trichoderma novae-zelandiae]
MCYCVASAPQRMHLAGESYAKTWYARGPIGLESRIKPLVAWGSASCESWPTDGPASERQLSMLEMVLVTRHLFDAQVLGKLGECEMTPRAFGCSRSHRREKCHRIQAVR